MPIRKNAKFLSAVEKEAFVKACVLMKADIVNPLAPAGAQYSRWDENVAIHWMIQNGFSPAAPAVNFGHGGSGAYSFFSWHRFFLHQVEQQLQSYVPGVMIPYWDWSDPSPMMADTFLGPNGTTGSKVVTGYFAETAPGTGANTTPAPTWWPTGLSGWLLPSAFGSGSGALRRGLAALSGLPTVADLNQALSKTTYPAFQNAVEGGIGLTSGNQMHNGMHGWIGGSLGQMSFPSFSPFDPFFYLHHCNIDRLWAMWQMDGHADEYPVSGGHAEHNRNDIMYPWTGGTPGYGTTAGISSAIPMPDFSALGAKRNVDTLDHRGAFGVSYDTLAIVGIGLDRTGSMSGVTPDPMTTSAPDVSKWEAAKRGVSAFLQDCETVKSSGVTYVMAGVKTFRELGANDFQSVFPSPGYGLVKSGSTFSRSAFDSTVAAMTPGGGTPLADALLDVSATIVEAPYAGVPADERRYLAMLTDGLLTAGAPMSSIPDDSLARTAVFSMGFGTGADVDYVTLQSMVDKGVTLATQQVFHGENAGTIDKFYTNALARAIGFTTVFDPAIEMFAGEFVHVDFFATSADDAFLIVAQGMDFSDEHWTYRLHAPDGSMLHGEAMGAAHTMDSGCMMCCRKPHVTATEINGRLSLMLQRDSADDACWVGLWRLMVSYRARKLDAMLMPTVGSLLTPIASGPARGPRYTRLLLSPKRRTAQRNVVQPARHPLDEMPVSTNRNDREACDLAVNIYARSRLQVEFLPDELNSSAGGLVFNVHFNVLQGNAQATRALARLVAPTHDLKQALKNVNVAAIPPGAVLHGSRSHRHDPALVLADLEAKRPDLTQQRDLALPVVQHGPSLLHAHYRGASTPGSYNASIYIEGDYCPEHDTAMPSDGGHTHGQAPADPAASACGPDCKPERFIRLLTALELVGK